MRRPAAMRRAFGQTRWGRLIRRTQRRRARVPRLHPSDPARLADPGDARALAEALAQRPAPRRLHIERRPPAGARGVRDILLVSHCDFTGNSALHAYHIAAELHARGFSPALAVPDDPGTVEEIGRPPFPILTYRQARERTPDLVHAFTPRERVRRLTAAVVANTGCPYVVHLEDNDRAILAAELRAPADELEQLPVPVLDGLVGDGQVHPRRGPHFVRGASGVSVVIASLLELAPRDVPSAVVRPGVDESLPPPTRSRDTVRSELGLREDDFAVVYTGTVHAANAGDMRALQSAIEALRRDGDPVVLVKTGWNAPDAPELLNGSVRDLGWVSRSTLVEVIAAADVLVQPGHPGAFNDYRFPAKLPELLRSGRPVVLTRTNLGRELQDGREAIVLATGAAEEFYGALARLRADPHLAETVGAGGRAFALRELRWSASVDNVDSMYREAAALPPPLELELPPAVTLTVRLPEPPTPADRALIGRYGISAVEHGAGSGGEVEPRRAVLRALARGEPAAVVDAGAAWQDAQAREHWLRRARAEQREGIRLYYASRGLQLDRRTLRAIVPA